MKEGKGILDSSSGCSCLVDYTLGIQVVGVSVPGWPVNLPMPPANDRFDVGGADKEIAWLAASHGAELVGGDENAQGIVLQLATAAA